MFFFKDEYKQKYFYDRSVNMSPELLHPVAHTKENANGNKTPPTWEWKQMSRQNKLIQR